MAFGEGMRTLSLKSGVAPVELEPKGASSPLAAQARLVRTAGAFVPRGPRM